MFFEGLATPIFPLAGADGKRITYTYDAWGNFTQQLHRSDGIDGFYRNNFRYRGYYYEESLGLYRTQTRIYKTGMNNDGSIHDKRNGIPNLTRPIKEWLKKHNWATEIKLFT